MTMCGRLAGRVAVFCALLLSTTYGADDADDDGVTYEAVVPPGQDDLMAALLGRAAVLPAECRFDGGGADGSVISARYHCPSGDVAYELTHPDKGDDGAVKTEQFALNLRSGSPPAGLQDALVAQIRYREPHVQCQGLPTDDEAAAAAERAAAERAAAEQEAADENPAAADGE
jgi:hypothetical protein